MSDLKGKVILVTGGNGLLGKAIIMELLKAGGICINADIQNDSNFSLCEYYQTDITDDSTVNSLVSDLISKHGRIDGLVNNAYPRTQDWGNKFEQVTISSWRTNVEWQLNSFFYLTQKVALKMIDSRGGSIINIASIYGSLGPDFTVYEGTSLTSPVAYAAIKGGVINLTRYLASYLGCYGIRVNAISPGGVLDNQPDSFVENYEKKVPLKRMATPNDIAPVIKFLLSEDAGYITGQNLIVDGGWSCI